MIPTNSKTVYNYSINAPSFKLNNETLMICKREWQYMVRLENNVGLDKTTNLITRIRLGFADELMHEKENFLITKWEKEHQGYNMLEIFSEGFHSFRKAVNIYEIHWVDYFDHINKLCFCLTIIPASSQFGYFSNEKFKHARLRLIIQTFKNEPNDHSLVDSVSCELLSFWFSSNQLHDSMNYLRNMIPIAKDHKLLKYCDQNMSKMNGVNISYQNGYTANDSATLSSIYPCDVNNVTPPVFQKISYQNPNRFFSSFKAYLLTQTSHCVKITDIPISYICKGETFILVVNCDYIKMKEPLRTVVRIEFVEPIFDMLAFNINDVVETWTSIKPNVRLIDFVSKYSVLHEETYDWIVKEAVDRFHFKWLPVGYPFIGFKLNFSKWDFFLNSAKKNPDPSIKCRLVVETYSDNDKVKLNTSSCLISVFPDMESLFKQEANDRCIAYKFPDYYHEPYSFTKLIPDTYVQNYFFYQGKKYRLSWPAIKEMFKRKHDMVDTFNSVIKRVRVNELEAIHYLKHKYKSLFYDLLENENELQSSSSSLSYYSFSSGQST